MFYESTALTAELRALTMLSGQHVRKTDHKDFQNSCSLYGTGQHFKKVKSKFYYSGKDKRVASKRHIEQPPYLHSIRKPGNMPFVVGVNMASGKGLGLILRWA